MPKRHRRKPPRPAGTLRIIGGRWRGRRISFAEAPGLRPTGDRLRETLFNWLAPDITGANCLDLFAGSGALGLEALSRGAASCLFIDCAPAVCRNLETVVAELGATGARVVCASSPQWLESAAVGPFDVVFIDPPFAGDLLAPALQALTRSDQLTTGAHIYVEYPAAAAPVFPAAWELLRERRTGDVGCALLGNP